MTKILTSLVLATASLGMAFADVTISEYINQDGKTGDPIGDAATINSSMAVYSNSGEATTLLVAIDLYTLATDRDLTASANYLAQLYTDQHQSSTKRGIGAYVNDKGNIVLCAMQGDDVYRVYETDVEPSKATTYSQGDVVVLTLAMQESNGTFYVYDGTTNTAATLNASGLTVDSASACFEVKEFNRLYFGSALGNDVISAYVYNTYLEGEALTSAIADVYKAAAPVPEPATATLSLLALAGLAARRRRK